MKKFIAIISKFFLVTLFGLPQACIGLGRVEYGCPIVDYQLKGVVMDEDSNPIKGIKVSLEDPDGYAENTTDASGQFAFDEKLTAFDIDKMKVFFQDIDGPDNGGEFALDSVEVKVYRIGEGDGNWFNGTFKSDDVEVRLKKKE